MNLHIDPSHPILSLIHSYANLLTATAYFVISVYLIPFSGRALKAVDRSDKKAFILTAISAYGVSAFILVCGIGHLVEAFGFHEFEVVWCAIATAPVSAGVAICLLLNIRFIERNISLVLFRHKIWDLSFSGKLILCPDGDDMRILDFNEAAYLMTQDLVDRPLKKGDLLGEILPENRTPNIVNGKSMIEFYKEVFDDGVDGSFEVERYSRFWDVRFSRVDDKLLVVFEDRTTEYLRRKELEEQAVTDSLVGCFNQTWLKQNALSVIAGLIFIDLNRFKSFNDLMGHDVGNEILVVIGNRLKEVCGDLYHLVRFGGDEFVIVPASTLEATSAVIRDTANRALEAIKEVFYIDKREIQLSAAIGVSDCVGMTLKEHLKVADSAMYQAKKNDIQKAGLVITTTPKLREKQARESVLALAIPASLERYERKEDQAGHDEFFLAYQPIVKPSSPDSYQVAALEALIRWKTASGELISPAEFIPIAEAFGYTYEIFRLVFHRVLTDITRWKKQGLWAEDWYVSINIAPSDCRRINFLDTIKSMLAEFPMVDPSNIAIEITERELIEDIDSFAAILSKIGNMRIGIEMDDFGAGKRTYTELIQAIGFDTLKVDGSLQVNPNSPADIQRRTVGVLKSIMLLGRSIGVKMLMEGVETQEQADLTKNLGFDMFQGFYFYKPIFDSEIDDFLSHQLLKK